MLLGVQVVLSSLGRSRRWWEDKMNLERVCFIVEWNWICYCPGPISERTDIEQGRQTRKEQLGWKTGSPHWSWGQSDCAPHSGHAVRDRAHFPRKGPNGYVYSAHGAVLRLTSFRHGSSSQAWQVLWQCWRDACNAGRWNNGVTTTRPWFRIPYGFHHSAFRPYTGSCLCRGAASATSSVASAFEVTTHILALAQ
jgi:hypothetical protein